MYAVIMAGGSGTRFWPASRRHRPKQLLSLIGERSLLQQTVERLEPLCPPSRVLVVTGQSHAASVVQQLPQLPSQNILVEPMARNTAAAAALSAVWVAAREPEEVCLVLPSDQLITDQALFLKTLSRAAQAAREQEALVTLGLTPRFPATGFGYIQAGQVLDPQPPKLSRVAAFHEKPGPEQAQAYLDSGDYLWNSGMFVWRAGVFLAEVGRHLPGLARAMEEIAPHLDRPEQAQVLARVYAELPSVSIDHGVMELSDNILMVRADFGWSDLGSWEAMGDIWPQDPAGNISREGSLLAVEASNNLVAAGERLTVLAGVRDLVVVVTDDVVLVQPRSRSQALRDIIKLLKERGDDQYL